MKVLFAFFVIISLANGQYFYDPDNSDSGISFVRVRVTPRGRKVWVMGRPVEQTYNSNYYGYGTTGTNYYPYYNYYNNNNRQWPYNYNTNSNPNYNGYDYNTNTYSNNNAYANYYNNNLYNYYNRGYNYNSYGTGYQNACLKYYLISAQGFQLVDDGSASEAGIGGVAVLSGTYYNWNNYNHNPGYRGYYNKGYGYYTG
ncbi:unnamed protein product [Bursaphelenchus xylophilus]|uniref:(pine wood nematode) hypothetical protein n=1 Tax=Bursaphelenchus xylophilus TaxID=6326 RepID=A0A1I7RT34_BURXY|nr:unnamed protein product [Bursaphelenchus xylophilus]CAG9122644.1 unnamed protein product [Bursaphelenchus xylophilus]